MPDRTRAPEAGLLERIEFPPLATDSINGIPVLEIANPDHKIVYLECVFDSGRLLENIPGISWYATKMLLEGTLKLNARQIAEKIEGLGSYIDVTAGIDQVFFKLYCLSDKIEESIDLLFAIFRNPSFPSAEFSILKNIRTQNLENILARNSQFASLTFTEKLFGRKHPYGRIMLPEDAKNPELSEVQDYYQKALFSNPKLIIGGKYRLEVVEKVTEVLKEISVKNTIDHPLVSSTNPETLNLKRENGTQSSIRIGALCMDRTNEKIHEFSIANTLLGGFFGSRLMKSVREEKGLSYGIYSSVNHHLTASYQVISAEVRSEKKQEAIDAIFNEIELLSNNIPSTRELDVLKNYLYGKIQSSMDSMFSIINLQKDLFLNDLDMKFLQSYQDKLSKISGEQISEITRKEFLEKKPVIVTVS